MNACAKRLLDLTGALLGLVLLSPLLLAISVAIRLRMGAPVLFRQTRPGYRSRPFTVFKFRTMAIVDMASSHVPDAGRITSLGAWLRRLSLDELPQLWNVFLGEMSLVGPRPLLMAYLNRYTPEQARRQLVKPGITGWAQIHGRNALSWEEKLDLDVWYADHHSFLLDLCILAKTVARVWQREGISQPGHATMPEFMGSGTAEKPRSPLADK